MHSHIPGGETVIGRVWEGFSDIVHYEVVPELGNKTYIK